MCLHANHNTCKIATRDITVYKVLAKKEGKLVSPYQKTVYNQGKTKSSTLKITEVGSVHFGLHTFKRKKDTAGEFEYWNSNYSAVVVPMVIPKGAKYFEGTFEQFDCYASNKLFFPKLKNNGNSK